LNKLTIGPRRVKGAKVPLFERLFGGVAAKQNRFYDAGGLTQAIMGSLTQLLSVRAPILAVGKQANDRTILDYGIVETEGLSPLREDDRAFLGRELLQAVTAFEPRLENPEIKVRSVPESGQSIQLHITGQIRLGTALEPFEFVTAIGKESEQETDD